MSSYERTAIQAVIGQKPDGQLQKLVSENERLILQKRFKLRRICAETAKFNPDLSNRSTIPIPKSDDLAYLYVGAEKELHDKVQVHDLTNRSLRAAQLSHGFVGSVDDKPIVQTALICSIMTLIEAGLNAAFFNNAHMVTGPTAALLTSFLISATNVVACCCAGFFIGRYQNYGINAPCADESYYRGQRRKARLQLMGFIIVMVFFHLTVGLIRTQETIEAVNHSPMAYLEMLQTPEAIFLIIMGGCMSIIAYHKGIHSFDCPYPEIGRLQRAEVAAKEDIHNTFDYFQDEITDYFTSTEKEIEDPIKNQIKSVEQYNKSVSACHEAWNQLEQTVRDAETHCRGELAELTTSYCCISSESQEVPADILQQMMSFEKYLDVQIPAFHSLPEITSFKSELLLEKTQAVKRLATIFKNATQSPGGKS